MADYTFIKITRTSPNQWVFNDDEMPDPSLPRVANAYEGYADSPYLSLKTRTGGNIYNHQHVLKFEYVDEVNPGNSYSPTNAAQFMQFLEDEGFFGDSSGGGGGATTFLQLLDVLFPSYLGRDGQFIYINGNGLSSMDASNIDQNNIVRIFRFTATSEETVNAQYLADKFNNSEFAAVISPVDAPVLISVMHNGYTYIYTYNKGKGGMTGLTQNDFFLISVFVTSPDDITNDPNAVITNIDPVTDGDYIAKLNITEWDLTDSGEVQDNGGVKTYYFTYTDGSTLYYVQFIGEPGVYGGDGNPAFTDDDFATVTNSGSEPAITKTSQLENDGDGTSPFVTEAGLANQQPVVFTPLTDTDTIQDDRLIGVQDILKLEASNTCFTEPDNDPAFPDWNFDNVTGTITISQPYFYANTKHIIYFIP